MTELGYRDAPYWTAALGTPGRWGSKEEKWAMGSGKDDLPDLLVRTTLPFHLKSLNLAGPEGRLWWARPGNTSTKLGEIAVCWILA